MMANAQATQAQMTLQSATRTEQVQPVAPTVPEITTAASQIRLATFDPDDTPFTMLWMDDVSRIKHEFGISDTLIVLKAGHALRVWAVRFYQHWQPIIRDWDSFRPDFQIAFPEQGTPATHLRACLIMPNLLQLSVSTPTLLRKYPQVL